MTITIETVLRMYQTRNGHDKKVAFEKKVMLSSIENMPASKRPLSKEIVEVEKIIPKSDRMVIVTHLTVI